MDTIESKREATRNAMARIKAIKDRAREQARMDVASGDELFYLPYDKPGDEYIFRATYNDALFELEEAGILESYSDCGRNYLRVK